MFKSVRLMLFMNRRRPVSRRSSTGAFARERKPISLACGDGFREGKRWGRKDASGVTRYMLEYSEDRGKTWKVAVFTTPEDLEAFRKRHSCFIAATANQTPNEDEGDSKK